MRPLDTSPEAERVQMELFRRMGPERRLHVAIELSQTTRKLLAEGVLRRHPDYTEAQVRLAVLRLLLPAKLFIAAYPEAEGIQP